MEIKRLEYTKKNRGLIQQKTINEKLQSSLWGLSGSRFEIELLNRIREISFNHA